MGHDVSPARGATEHRIVVLDGYTANPGDLSWDKLGEVGELSVYDRTPPEETVDRAAGATVVLTNKVVLDAPRLSALEELRMVSVLATGTNVVDLDAARTLGITVCNVPAYSTASTAQHAIALLLELCQHVGDHARGVREGGWTRSVDFSYAERPLRELDGLTLGVVGFGAIGARVAAIAKTLGMRVIVFSRTPKQVAGVRFVSFEELLRESDVITLHCPLTEKTKHLIDDKALSSMKPSAFLVNTARGPLLDEAAVAKALHEGKLAGFAADVLSKEPPTDDNPLLTAPNAYVTPHHAWASRAARKRLIDVSVANVRAFFNGHPENVVV